MTKEDLRNITEDGLIRELMKLADNYMKVYDEYYETGSRDSAFLKDLVDAIQGICAVLEVYTTQSEIHPSYATEKLKYSLSIIEQVKRYFESKMEVEE